MRTNKDRTTNPIILGAGNDATPGSYLFQEIEMIPANDLEISLLTLSFQEIEKILTFFDEWSKKSTNLSLVLRLIKCILIQNRHQILQNQKYRLLLDGAKSNLLRRVMDVKRMMSVNLAAVDILKRHWSESHSSTFGEGGVDPIKKVLLKRKVVS